MRKLASLLSAVSCLLVAYAGPASGYSFTVLNDVPAGSFGVGTPVGTTYQFNSPNMSASASGNFGFDLQNFTLTLRITAGAGETIDEIVIQEIGDILFSGTGTDLSYVLLTMSGSGVIEATTGGDIPDVAFNFGGIGDPWFPVSTPASLVNQSIPGYGLTGGNTAYQGTLLLDIEALVADATQVTFTLNNGLWALSETGTSAFIDKNSVHINVVPEPTTAALICGGLLALSIRARRRRA
jgi:hypothetical protein